jgi:hypothetical protein
MISENIYERCVPAISTDINRCGSISNCNLGLPESDELTAIFGDGASGTEWTINQVLFTVDYEAKACGVKQNGLYDLIRAMSVPMSKRLAIEQLTKETLMVKPFINVFRDSILNLKYWAATGGVVSGNNWQIDVENIGGNVPADTRFFPVGMRVFIEGQSATGAFIETAYEVVTVTAVNTNKARLVLESHNANSNLAAANVANPTRGVLTRGLPLVSQYESWCDVDPGLNTRQQVPVWVEENRLTTCENELYEQYHRLLKANNPRYREYGNIDTVVRNRQVLQNYQENKVNQWFFGKPLANQTLDAWNSLEEITIPTNANLALPFEGQCVGRRASNIGVLEQLADCGRVYDNKLARLNIAELQTMLYNLSRVRKAKGGNGTRIDCITSTWFKSQIQMAMVNYFNTKSAGLLRFNMELNQKNETLGFSFDTYALDYPNVTWVVASHEYFDDKKDARRTSGLTDAEELWFLDFADIQTWTFDADRTTNTSGSAQEVARVDSAGLCIPKRPKLSYTHVSETWANFVECPARSAIIRSISPQVPVYQPSDPLVHGQTSNLAYGYNADI